MQFVLVFIDKFINLVKPYQYYEFFEDGVDRGYAIRECSKRIIEIANDRDKLRESRQESFKLKQRIVGKDGSREGGSGGGGSGGAGGFRNFNMNSKIDEDAFFKQKQPNKDRFRPKMSQSNSPNKNRGGAKELTQAEKQGQKEGNEEDKDHVKKRTKEDQKEVDEIKKILAEPGKNMAEMMEFDIFDQGPVDDNKNNSPTKTETKKEGGGLPPPPAKVDTSKNVGLPPPPAKKEKEPTSAPVTKSGGQDDIFDFIGNANQANLQNAQKTAPQSQLGQNNQPNFSMDLLGGGGDMNMNNNNNMNNQNQVPQMDMMGQNVGFQQPMQNNNMQMGMPTNNMNMPQNNLGGDPFAQLNMGGGGGNMMGNNPMFDQPPMNMGMNMNMGMGMGVNTTNTNNMGLMGNNNNSESDKKEKSAGDAYRDLENLI